MANFTTLPASGQILTAATLAALINENRPIRAEKTTNGTAFPSTTSMANETGMAVALAAGVEYDFDAAIVYEAGTVGDIRIGWTFPTAAFRYQAQTVNTAGAGGIPVPSDNEVSDTFKAFGGLGIGTPTVVWYTGFITVTSAGSLQLRRAQNTSTAENTRINSGSWMRIRQAV